MIADWNVHNVCRTRAIIVGGARREGDLKRFDEVVRLLNELDVIYTENPTTDLKQALWILEDDLFELHRRERLAPRTRTTAHAAHTHTAPASPHTVARVSS